MAIGPLTNSALPHFVHDLKATLMNLQQSLIQELMYYKFKLGHNITEKNKNTFYMKGEIAVDLNTKNMIQKILR